MTQTRLEPAIHDEIEADAMEVHRINEDEIEKLRDELADEREAHLRLAAEYQNYRRRTAEEKNDAAAEGKRDLLMRIVSLADDLDFALANVEESPGAVAEGLKMIDRRFRDTLEGQDLIAFESLGQAFDPERHEAFAMIDVGDVEPGTVYKQLRTGYFWKEKLLRPALVVVAR